MNRRFAKVMPNICQWLEANGIQAGRVPIEAVPEIFEHAGARRMRLPMHLLNEAGQRYVVGGAVAEHVFEVPLRVEPPEVLNDWLAGKVPPR